MGKDLKGRELGAGILQRKSGRYDARFVNRFGKRISFSGYDLKEVKKRLNEAIYEDQRELNTREDVKLDRWFREWMDVYKYDVIRENTRRQYNQIYTKHISPILGNFNLSSITQVQIKKLLKDLDKKGYGYETKNRIRILLVDIFNKAMVNEYVRKNPAKGITIRRNENVERRVLTQEEQTAFFDCSKGTFYDNLFVTAVSTGMRIGELAALRWCDIDWDQKVIHVTRTLVYQKFDGDEKKEFHLGDPKTATSVRDIPISRQCEIALKKQYMQKAAVKNKMPLSKELDKQYEDLLFTTKFNTPLNSQLVKEAIDKIVGEINLTRDFLDEMETFSAHCFRHTFATRCFEAGIQPKTVQSYLGHATLQMTMDLYTSVMPKHMIAEMDKVSDVMDKISEAGDKLAEDRFAEAKSDNIIPICGGSMVV